MKEEVFRNEEKIPWLKEDSVFNLVKRTSYVMRRDIEQVLRPIGITPQQAFTLRLLLHRPGMTQTELESALQIEKSSVCSLINGLADRNWVERRQHPDDARIRQIYITPEGEALNAQATPLVEQAKGRGQTLLTPEEEMILNLLLKKVLRAHT